MKFFFALKPIINIACITLQGISVAYVGYVVSQNLTRIQSLDVDVSGFTVAIVGVLGISFFSLGLQIWAWVNLLRGASVSPMRARNAYWVFGRTAIAKYLPGNLFHYVGRQALAEKLGCGQRAVLAGTMAEVAVTVAAACSVAVVPTLIIQLPAATWLPQHLTEPVLLAGILLPLATLAAAKNIASLRSFTWLEPLARIRVRAWLTAYFLYVMFVLVGILGLSVVIFAIYGRIEAEVGLTVVAAYGLSYVVGYLTPGAPGGIGIREALLVLFLAPELGEPVIVCSAIILRLCSIMAETLLFATTFYMVPAADS